MVLSPPAPHAAPAEAAWFDRVVFAIGLAAHGVLALVDGAAPGRLREAYLRLRARDPATEVIVGVRALASLPSRATVILVIEADIAVGDLDWLNFFRPIVADRAFNLVLWCPAGGAAVLAQRAPDFFDWISVRVDCPPAPAAHAVADVKAAIRARAAGIAWDGPGLEETLASVRPGRPLRRVTVGSYQSMIDALTSREPGWLVLEGVDSGFHLRRLRWAMAETGRRVIVFRPTFAATAPGWWTVHAVHVPIAEAVRTLTEAGGSGRLAALVGLDPDACRCARLALARGIPSAQLEAQLVGAGRPRVAISHLAPDLCGRDALESERDSDPTAVVLRERQLSPDAWAQIGLWAGQVGDLEVAMCWLGRAIEAASGGEPDPTVARWLVSLGRTKRWAGDVAGAGVDIERALELAISARDPGAEAIALRESAALLQERGELAPALERVERALAIARSAPDRSALPVANTLRDLGSIHRSRGDLVSARSSLEEAFALIRAQPSGQIDALTRRSMATLLHELAGVLLMQGDLAGAHLHVDESLALARESAGSDDHQEVAQSLHLRAMIKVAQGDRSARDDLDQALGILRRIAPTNTNAAIANVLQGLATVLLGQGDVDAASDALEESLAIATAMHGDKDPAMVATTLHELGSLALAQGDAPRARAHLERALATMRRTYGTEIHPQVATSMHELARVSMAEGDQTGARDLLKRVLDLELRIHGTRDHFATAKTEITLAMVLRGLGQVDEALSLARHALDVFRTQLGNDHPSTDLASQVVARLESAERVVG